MKNNYVSTAICLMTADHDDVLTLSDGSRGFGEIGSYSGGIVRE